MLLGTTAGQSYSLGELRAMLKAVGFIDIRRIPLKLPNGDGGVCRPDSTERM